VQVVEGLAGDTAAAVAVAKEQRRAAELQRELCAVRSEAAEGLRVAHRKLGEEGAQVGPRYCKPYMGTLDAHWGVGFCMQCLNSASLPGVWHKHWTKYHV
jgi:hypothetical protein